jgi:hypothetical protein
VIAVGVLAGVAAGVWVVPDAWSAALAGDAVAVTGADGARTGAGPAGRSADRTMSQVAPSVPSDEEELAKATGDGPRDPSAPPAATPTATPPPLPPGLTAADVSAGLLSAAVPTSGAGEVVVAPGEVTAPGAGAKVYLVNVSVEGGLDVDPVLFANTVMTTLNDPRSWGHDGSVTFARTAGEADINVVLASPDLVDELCAPLRTVGTFSCGRSGRAVINHTRWVLAQPEFGGDLTTYRQYVVNHEVGHLLGHPHVRCPGAGRLAPLMQQQSVQVSPCLPNAWPFPTG